MKEKRPQKRMVGTTVATAIVATCQGETLTCSSKRFSMPPTCMVKGGGIGDFGGG